MNPTKISVIIVVLAFLMSASFITAACIADRQEIENSSSGLSGNSVSKKTSESSSVNDNALSDSGEPETTEQDKLKYDEAGKELPYDVTPVVEAYKTGDTSALTPKQKIMLDAAHQVLHSIIIDNMSDYEKELEIHDYIILNTCYNEKNLNILGESDEDDSTPYGMLINGQSICKGYATVFELLCNMAGIECKTIVEYSKDEPNKIEHAFNRVYIENSWYYVDTTWDDKDFCSKKEEIYHKYFNLTKGQMAYNHALDDSCPESASTEYTYASQTHTVISSAEELKELVGQYKGLRCDQSLFVLPDPSSGIRLTFSADPMCFDSSYDTDEYEQLAMISDDLGMQTDRLKVKAGDDIILCIYISYTGDYTE